MSTTFYTKSPVTGDLDTESPDIIFTDAENDFRSAEKWMSDMTTAFKSAGINDGDIVFSTVAYSDGVKKPGNFRNQRNVVRYQTYATGEEVELRSAPREVA